MERSILLPKQGNLPTGGQRCQCAADTYRSRKTGAVAACIPGAHLSAHPHVCRNRGGRSGERYASRDTFHAARRNQEPVCPPRHQPCGVSLRTASGAVPVGLAVDRQTAAPAALAAVLQHGAVDGRLCAHGRYTGFYFACGTDVPAGAECTTGVPSGGYSQLPVHCRCRADAGQSLSHGGCLVSAVYGGNIRHRGVCSVDDGENLQHAFRHKTASESGIAVLRFAGDFSGDAAVLSGDFRYLAHCQPASCADLHGDAADCRDRISHRRRRACAETGCGAAAPDVPDFASVFLRITAAGFPQGGSCCRCWCACL